MTESREGLTEFSGPRREQATSERSEFPDTGGTQARQGGALDAAASKDSVTRGDCTA